jgi:hypothetical protein
MNERIRELAEQAGIQFPNNLVEGVNGPGVVSPKDKLAKFAELIVRECAEIATYPQLGDEESYYGNEFAKAIKKHFGVE